MAARNPQPAGGARKLAAAAGAVTTSSGKHMPKFPGMIKIRAVRGRGLLNRETLGCSDPYLKIFDATGKLVFETEAKPSTQHPEWPNDSRSRCAFRIHSHRGDLVVQAWDKNKLSDQPLGEIIIPVMEAAGYRGEVNHQVHPRRDEDDDMILAQRNNLGTVTLDFAYEHEPLTSLANREPDPNLPSALPAMLNIKVLSALGLKNREATGTSDPYVKVAGPDGSKLIKTNAMPSTLNPVWSGASATASTRVRASSQGTLCFQVWDKNTVSDEFMGEVQVPIQEAVAFATEKMRKIPMILRPRDQEEDEFVRENAKALGSIVVEFSLEPETLEAKPSKPPGTFTITVESATGLLQRRLVGKAAPYVKFLDADGEELFATTESEVDVRRTVEWKQAEATTTFRIFDEDASLTLQVWDKAAVRDTFLGEVRLTATTLLRLATEPESTLALRPRQKETDAQIKKQQDDLGQLVCQVRYANEAHFQLTPRLAELDDIKNPPGLLVAYIKNCKRLIPRADRPSVYLKVLDPCGRVVFGEKESRPFQNSTEPTWEEDNASAQIRLAHLKGLLTFQLWDKRVINDDFLGEVVVSVRDAVDYAQYPEARFMVRPRERERDKFIVENKDQLGSMTISFTFLPDQTPLPDVDIPGTINGVFSVSVVGAKDLCNFEATGISDPYVQVISPDELPIFRTATCENTLEPVWEVRNTCDVPVHSSAGYIFFQAWDDNTIIDDLMGEARLSLHEAYAYATLAKNRSLTVEERTITLPLRVPLKSKANEKKIKKNENQLGVVKILIEFTPGDDKKSAAEVEKQRLFNMSIPLDFVVNHIEKSNESSTLSAELLLYIPFLIMFIFFALARRSTLEEHYIAAGYDRMLTEHEIPPVLFNQDGDSALGLDYLKTYWTIQTPQHFHIWLEGVVAPQFWDWRNPTASSIVYGPFGGNEAIGAMRLRQYRMSPDSCAFNTALLSNTSNQYGSFPAECYSEFDMNSVDHRKLVMTGHSTVSINYTDGCDYSFVSTAGDLYTYPCGGHQIDLPFANATFNRTLTTLRTLNLGGFFNETSVRFIIVEWFSYNRALDIFTSCKYFMEVTSGGGWAPSAYVRSFRVHRDGATAFYFVYDLFFTAFVGYYWYKFFRDWVRAYRRTGLILAHLLTVWTVLELLNLVVFVVALGFHFAWYGASFKFTNNIPTMDMTAFPMQLDYLLNLFYTEVLCNAANSVLCFLKILTFLKMNAKLSLLTRTMGRAADNILGVLAVFTLIVIAYALSGNQLYGTALFEYRNLSSAMSALFRALMGDFDYDELRNRSRPTTFFYFWSFIIIGLFVMLNFCTAIIGSAYEQEQDAEKTLPLAVALRRFARELKSMSLRQMVTVVVNAFVKRTRRLPDDIIFEHLYQYRSTLYQIQGVDEIAVRAGEIPPPELLINYKQFLELLPRKEIDYITMSVLDHKYLVIAEDFVVLHHDEDKAKEDHLAVVFTRAIHTGFRRVLVDRFAELQGVQQTLLVGEAPVHADAKPSLVTHGKKGDFTDALASRSTLESAAVNGAQKNVTANFDAAIATEKLMKSASAIVDVKEGTGKRRRVAEISDEIKREQSRVARLYVEDSIGAGSAGRGLRQALAESGTLSRITLRLQDITSVRAHAFVADIDGELLNAPPAVGRGSTAAPSTGGGVSFM